MPTPDELHARALDLLMKGDTGGGIDDLKKVLETDPEDAEAWLELGTAYASIQHWVQAADALRRSVDLDGEEVEARLAYARVLVQLKKLDLAAFQLVQAAKLSPEDARVLKELGLVFYDKRLFEKAVTFLTRATVLDPKDARARYALGLAHEARRDMGAAVAAYREAVRRDPSLLDARRTLADALASMGEHEGAIAELSALLEVDRTNEQAARNREVLLRALGEMLHRRLLGKGQKELEESALVSEGGFRKRGTVDGGGGGGGGALTVKYTAPMVELHATFDAAHAIESLLLMLTDPEEAARAADDAFKVTVIGEDGRQAPVNFATAVSLTFVREALGCPMTKASELYARLLGGEKEGEREVEWGGAMLGFTSVPRPGLRAGVVRAGRAGA